MRFWRGFLAIKSLLVGLAVLALWGRSYFTADLVRKGSATQFIQLGSAAGSTLITFGHDGQKTRLQGRWEYVRAEEPREMLASVKLGDSVWNRIGFGFRREIVYSSPPTMHVTLVVPHWLIFLLAIPSALRWAIRRARAGAVLAGSAGGGEDPRLAMYECPNCRQMFARVPPQCPVCGQPLVGGEYV